MSSLIIHLSDIHFSKESINFANRAEKISEAALSTIASIQDIHIVVSGDLVNWGLDEEFDVGVDFIERIRASIKERSGIKAEVLFSSGNHDCNFSGDQSVRDLLVNTVRNDPQKLTDGIAKQFSGVLKRFYQAQKKFCESIIQNNEWVSTAIVGSECKIRYVLLNSSLMSLKKEGHGKLFMPTVIPISEDAGSWHKTIYVMHHPFNWFNPENARELAQHAASVADLFLMGHEHMIWAQSTKELYENNSITYLKGHVLRDPENADNSAFQVIQVDNKLGFALRTYRWDGESYVMWLEKSREDYIEWPSQSESRSLTFSKEYYGEITSAGASFTHRKKEIITLPDIFVWPSLRPENSSVSAKGDVVSYDDISAEKLINEYEKLPGLLIIRGNEQSGKTALSKMISLNLQRRGFYPLLLSATHVSSWRERSINERIDSIIDSAYGKSQRSNYRQLHPGKKVLIIDDFDLLQTVGGRSEGLKALKQHFGKIIIFLDYYPGIEVALNEYLTDECFVDSKVYEIQEMKSSERLELIEKWLSIGSENQGHDGLGVTAAKLSKVVDETLGRNLIPSSPVFVLIILQRAELAQDIDTIVKSGSHGFLYESLILQALSSKVKALNVVASLAYLTSFSKELMERGTDYLSQVEYEEFHVNHCKRYALIAPINHLQTQLISADIIEGYGEKIRFKYPFHNYYFTARSLSQIRDWLLLEPEIDRLVSAIHTERNANVLLFLAHLERNPRIAEKIIEKSDQMFSSSEEADIYSPNTPLSSYGSSAIRTMLLEGPRGIQFRDRESDLVDAELSQNELAAMAEERLKGRLQEALSMNAAFKTLQVLGQILRNHAGEIDANEKKRIAEKCTALGLKVLGFLFDMVSQHGGEMISFRAAQMRAKNLDLPENRRMNDVEIAKKLEDYLPSFISSITIGTFIKIANAIGAEDLTPTLNETLDKSPTKKLIKIITQLEHFSDFPKKDVLDFQEDHLSNSRLFLPNVIIRRFIIRRFYLFPVRDELKRDVLAKFQIRALPFKFLEQKKIDENDS